MQKNKKIKNKNVILQTIFVKTFFHNQNTKQQKKKKTE